MNSTRLIFLLALLLSTQACAQGKPVASAPAKKPTAIAQSTSIPASTEDKLIREAITRVAPTVKIGAIKSSPIAGMKEVVIDGKVVYVSNDGKLLLQGALIDMDSRTNLTDASEAVIHKGLLAAVPNARKISFAPAKPLYRVTVFTDIDCGFCRKMHNQMAEYNKLGIAIDYLFFPRGGLASESFQKAVNVWCAPNRQVAMTLAKNDKPVAKKDCLNYVTMDFNLGLQVGVGGTPAVYAQNGASIGGYLSPADMLKALQKQAN